MLRVTVRFGPFIVVAPVQHASAHAQVKVHWKRMLLNYLGRVIVFCATVSNSYVSANSNRSRPLAVGGLGVVKSCSRRRNHWGTKLGKKTLQIR
jgi:hypothetical protein